MGREGLKLEAKFGENTLPKETTLKVRFLYLFRCIRDSFYWKCCNLYSYKSENQGTFSKSRFNFINQVFSCSTALRKSRHQIFQCPTFPWYLLVLYWLIFKYQFQFLLFRLKIVLVIVAKFRFIIRRNPPEIIMKPMVVCWFQGE